MSRWRKKTGNWHFWLGNMTISRSATGQTFLHMENTKALPRVNKCHVLRRSVLGDRSVNHQCMFFTLALIAGKVKGFAYLLSNRSLSSQQGKAGPALGPETDNIYTCSTQTKTHSKVLQTLSFRLFPSTLDSLKKSPSQLQVRGCDGETFSFGFVLKVDLPVQSSWNGLMALPRAILTLKKRVYRKAIYSLTMGLEMIITGVKDQYLMILLTCEIWRRQWHPTPVLLPGKLHGWRSLVGCSPWGH